MKLSITPIRALRTMAAVFTIWASLCSGAAAQTIDPDPPFKSAYRLKPATGGWFQSEGNLGNINFDISDSGIAAGNWSTYREGKPIWYYFQGAIQYSSDAEEKRTGIIAVVESPLAEVLTGGACPLCPYVTPVFAQPEHRMRIEFTSSRTARFVYDGTLTIPLVAWMQGMPLFAPRDYSGEWLAIARYDTNDAIRPMHREAIAHMRLDALEGPEVYLRTTSSIGPIADFAPPPLSRRYKMSCIGPNATCTLILSSAFMDADGTNFPLIWVGDNEAGKYLLARENADRGYFINNNVRQFRVYGERDRVTLRASSEPSQSSPFGIIEVILMKLPDGIFDGREWGDLKVEGW